MKLKIKIVGLLMVLYSHVFIWIEATKFSACNIDDRWETFRCANINPFVDDKTVILTATGGLQWPDDLFCLGIRNSLKVSGTYQMSTQLITVAPRIGQRSIGLAFNAADDNNFDFILLRFKLIFILQ